MSHNHTSAGAEHRDKLRIVFGLTGLFLIIEVIGAILSNSLALLADAAHMLTDVGGLGLALFAIWFAARPANDRKTYGYYRIEILAALLNCLILLAVSAYIIFEAWRRFSDPPEVSSWIMIGVAIAGLIVNIIGARLLISGSSESLNIQGAYLEVVADMLGSIAVIVAGVIILFTGWWYADPIFSIGIGVFIIPRTWKLMNNAIHVLMEGTPDGLDIKRVSACIGADPQVLDVHDLHVWSITSGVPALSCHIRVTPEANGDIVLERLRTLFANTFDLHHSTVQIEHRFDCVPSYHDSADLSPRV